MGFLRADLLIGIINRRNYRKRHRTPLSLAIIRHRLVHVENAGLAQSKDHPIIILTCGCCYSRWTRDRRGRRQVKLALKTDSNVAVVGGDDRAADT